VLNGNGESTGTNWIDESGDLEGPILLTNTYSVGVVRDAVRAWANVKFPTTSADYDDAISLPVVSETWDGWVNDINGQHITAQNVFDLLDQKPDTGTVAEGDVGGGTGDACFEFKCGIGTSSRVVTINNQKYTLGVLVQANFGKRQDLMIAGVPVGKFLTDNLPIQAAPTAVTGKDGSIVVVVATDAPLLPEQLARVARRVPLGLGRTGMISDNSSGDLFFAFSTSAPSGGNLQQWSALSNDVIVDLFRAVPPAVEEAIVNSLVAGRTLGGVNGNKVYGIDTDRLVRVMKSWSPIHPVLP
jgi:L-aminopeptidase/D-esterase-like protein